MMHRRLNAEGTSFQQIKDEVRRDVMLYYLQQTKLWTLPSDLGKAGFCRAVGRGAATAVSARLQPS
jgi:hypothetical protein